MKALFFKEGTFSSRMSHTPAQKDNGGDTRWSCKWKEGKHLETHAGEEQGPQWWIDNVEDLVAEKDAEEREEEQNDQAHEKDAPAGSEVIFSLW